MLPCYQHMVLTEQMSSIPAIGQGDSGGPVVAARDGYAYASGIVSGIRGGGPDCNENSDGRICSKLGIVAPVAAFFQANPSYGILVYGGGLRY